MFIYATLNITFYWIAFKQNIFGWFWVIWNQHLKYKSFPFLSFITQHPKLGHLRIVWKPCRDCETPPFANKYGSLFSVFSLISISFFLYGGCCYGSLMWAIICLFSLSHSLLYLISSLSFSLSLSCFIGCLADIVYWYKNNTKARPAHTNYIFSMSIARGQGLAG